MNNYMGPVATKAMKGYSDEDLREAIDEFKVCVCMHAERAEQSWQTATTEFHLRLRASRGSRGSLVGVAASGQMQDLIWERGTKSVDPLMYESVFDKFVVTAWLILK